MQMILPIFSADGLSLCVCRIQSGSYLSTGWFTLILAMDMCKEIHIYGMINDTYCK